MFLQVKALGNSCSLYLMGSSTSKTSVMKGKNDRKYDTCWTTLTYVCVCAQLFPEVCLFLGCM